jgi:hypothetical protein
LASTAEGGNRTGKDVLFRGDGVCPCHLETNANTRKMAVSARLR